MLNKAKLILSNKTLLRRILVTLALLFVFKLGTFIVIPLIDDSAISNTMADNSFLNILNTFSGGALGQLSILALGISPYITASIVIQLLQMVVPKLKEWSEQGEVGKQKINRVTRYASVALAFVQALALLLGLSAANKGNIFDVTMVENTSLYWLYYTYMAIVITAGSCFVIWLADLITRHGLGNGSSMIITAGIVTTIPAMFATLHSAYIAGGATAASVASYTAIVLLYIGVIIGVVFLEAVTRKISIQYANRQGKSNSDIPIKLNSSGVIPVIFASTLMSLPTTILGLMDLDVSDNGFTFWVNQIFTNTEPLGMMLYIFLIFVFSFFYAFMQVDPEKINDNLQKSNAFIPGIRPGDETKNFISRVLFNVTLMGSTYLAVLAIIPIITAKVFNFDAAQSSVITIGGTSLLIIVGVAIETMKQLETEAKETTATGMTRE
ncbi:MAG: preprotein translocase subunit SecY [bacterium]